MIENQNEISKLAQDYEEAAQKAPVRPINDTMATRPRYGQMFEKFAKNANSVLKFGKNNFPPVAIENLSQDLPAFNAAFNGKGKGLERLNSLVTAHDAIAKHYGGNSPCIVSYGEGESDHEFLNRRSNKGTRESSDKIESPGIDPSPINGTLTPNIDLCENGECGKCVDCDKHGSAIRDSTIAFLNKDTPNGMRLLHAKNLVSALESLATHHDDKAGGSDQRFNECSHRHAHMATGLRMLATNLRGALQKDGIYHRDHFTGYGKSEQEI